VELIPPFSVKSGVSFRLKNFRAAYQFACVAKHYSDATNAAFVVDATRGMIPAYNVQDLSLSYVWRRFRFQAGVNNLADARYFTRRAAAYPGPGIIPADGRSFYGTVSFRW
jgi:Fe(3+) dicitrate transport protein